MPAGQSALPSMMSWRPGETVASAAAMHMKRYDDAL
jgi:hypothetical protein